jgi:3-methyladenine DNA glycosylase AlkD
LTTEQILADLRALGNPDSLTGMRRVGINTEKALGVRLPDLRKYAKPIRKNHAIALDLWQTGIHEARILATIVGDATQMTGSQMDSWANDFDSWDVCDQACINLFVDSPLAFRKAHDWSARPEEFVKRAGFALMAALAVHQKNVSNEFFLPFFPVIEREAYDGRNYVKKAVNWALRQTGKRNSILHRKALELAGKLQHSPAKPARWIAADALRELTSEKVMALYRQG